MCRVRCGSGGDTVGGVNNWDQEAGIQEGHTQLCTLHTLWYILYSCQSYHQHAAKVFLGLENIKGSINVMQCGGHL